MEKVVVFGAGNIGRGLLGELFSEAGCDVVFVEVDQALISALNNAHSYTIRVIGDAAREVKVNNVRAINADDVERVTEELRAARMAATAVGHANLQRIAPLVAEGMRKRRQQRVDAPLNIIMCENMLSVAAAFNRQIRRHIRSRSLLEYIDSHLGLVETSVERMVPGANRAVRDRDPLLVVTEPVDNLPLNREAFLGPIPEMPLFLPVGNIVAYYKKKLFTSNAGHAILGYLGYPKGYEYLADAVADDGIRKVVFGSLKESGRALIAECGFQEKEIESHITRLLTRYANRALRDTVLRVTKDPIRKLKPDERLIGPANLVIKHGGSPDNLVLGIVAALQYDNPDDPQAVALADHRKAHGIDSLLEKFCGVNPHQELGRRIKRTLATSTSR